MKRLLAVAVVIGGVAFATWRAYREGWTAGWIEAAVLPVEW